MPTRRFYSFPCSATRSSGRNTQRVYFLRELLVTGRKGQMTTTFEFSYDKGFDREARFFGVPDDDIAQARQLYLEWSGACGEGYRRGTTVKRR